MKKKNEARVLGPYRQDEKRWRIVILHPNGQRAARLYHSKDKALRAMPRALADLQSKLPLGPHLQSYLASLEARGLAANTITLTRSFLRNMFEGETAGMWTAQRVEETLALWAKSWSLPTRRLRLWQASKFWAWLHDKGKVATNPFAGIVLPGRANRGKPQLRLDEARVLCKRAIAEYEAGKPLAAAPIVMLAMGLRSSEILRRQARDIDDGGSILWIPSGKTANARRTLDVPPELRPLLVDLKRNKEPTDFVLGVNSRNKPWRHADLWEFMRGLCDRAGVPRVCPHSLRGLWASLAVRSGAACAAVAATLGHGSFAMTAAHYAKPDALDAARSENAAGLLFPKPPA